MQDFNVLEGYQDLGTVTFPYVGQIARPGETSAKHDRPQIRKRGSRLGILPLLLRIAVDSIKIPPARCGAVKRVRLLWICTDKEADREDGREKCAQIIPGNDYPQLTLGRQ